MNQIHNLPPNSFKTHFHIIFFQLSLGLTSGLFFPDFATEYLYAFLLAPVRAKCLAYP
jgi:hypothetical protein